jgi:lysophospholipase L1-like esterase
MFFGTVVGGNLVPTPPVAYTTWDPAKKAADIILTASDTKAETNSTTGGGSVLTVLGKSTGKVYFEVQPDQFYATNSGYLTGISAGTGTQASFPGASGAGANSRGLASTTTGSDTWLNGASSNNSAGGAANLSHYHKWAIDIDAGKAWCAISNRSSGAWIGGGDPALGTSPTFTFTANSTVYPMACPRRGNATISTDRNRLVGKFDPASWTGTPPTGFANGFTSTVLDPPILGVYESSTPTTDSAIPAPTLALINTYLDLEWTAMVEWTLQSASTAFYAWSLDGGTHSLRYTGGESGNWILRINGVDRATASSIITSADTGQRAQAGQFVTVRAWWDAGNNTRGIMQAVNGVYAYETTGTASAQVVATPTTGYLNSLSGGSPNADITQVALAVHSRTSSRVQSFQGCVLGDSTIASYDVVSGVPVPSLLRAAIDSRNVAIKCLAIGGATIAQQETNWTAFTGKADLRWVFIEVGLNDIDPAVSTATSIALIQSLVNAVNSAKPADCKVYIATMTPCYQRMITRYGAGTPANNSLAKWNAMNDAIMNLGGSPITGVDGRINAHTIAMDDGVGNLDAAYDGGDGIHPNNAGRQVIANAWIPQLEAGGFL